MATTTLPQLITIVDDLVKRLAALEADHKALRAEITARQTGDRLEVLETYAQNNSRRIDEMEVRYGGVVDEMGAIATDLQRAVTELAETDEVSGWKQWKEQQRAVGRLPSRPAGG